MGKSRHFKDDLFRLLFVVVVRARKKKKNEINKPLNLIK